MIFLLAGENHCYGRFPKGFIIERHFVCGRMERSRADDPHLLPLQGYQAGVGKQPLRSKELEDNPPQRRVEHSVRLNIYT